MAGHHSHPGTELGYVLEGSLTLMVDGQPPRELKVGDSFMNPAGKPHNAKAESGGAKASSPSSSRRANRWRPPAK